MAPNTIKPEYTNQKEKPLASSRGSSTIEEIEAYTDTLPTIEPQTPIKPLISKKIRVKRRIRLRRKKEIKPHIQKKTKKKKPSHL